MPSTRPSRIQHGGTPQEVLNAIYVVAEYLAVNGYVEASISKSGGASFHVQSRIAREQEYLAEVARLNGWRDEKGSKR